VKAANHLHDLLYANECEHGSFLACVAYPRAAQVGRSALNSKGSDLTGTRKVARPSGQQLLISALWRKLGMGCMWRFTDVRSAERRCTPSESRQPGGHRHADMRCKKNTTC